MWITEEGVQRGQDVETIMRNLMLAIFAAIHTSSNVLHICLVYHASMSNSVIRRSPMRCTILLQIQPCCSHSAKKSSVSWLRKVGVRQGWRR